MDIKIYTNPHCPYSKKAVTFLRRRRLKIEEKTLFKEEVNRLELIKLCGQMTTPVIEIDGEVILGFNDNRLLEIIKKNKQAKSE